MRRAVWNERLLREPEAGLDAGTDVKFQRGVKQGATGSVG